MRILSLLLLPLAVSAFAPATRSPLFSRQDASIVQEPEPVHDFFENNVAKHVQTVLNKADDLILKRGMRLVNHAPIFVTLGMILKQVGSVRYGLDIQPSALVIPTPASLALPTWVGYVLPVLVVSQVAAVLRSVLADNKDELSQVDISALAVSNYCFTKVLNNGSLLYWTLAAISSGFYARNRMDSSNEPTLSNLSIQITTPLASLATVLGVAAKLPQVLPPIFAKQPALASLLGMVACYGLVTKKGNSMVTKVVQATVLGGVLVSQLAAGALKVSNLMRVQTVVTAVTAYVAVLAMDKAREAVLAESN